MTSADGISLKLWLFELTGSGTLGVAAVVLLAILLILSRLVGPPSGRL